MNNRLDVFDIIRHATAEITSRAADFDIDWQASEPRLNDSTRGFKCTPLERDNKGKIKAWLVIKTAKSGQRYPKITFNHFKSGSGTLFDGWEWLENNGYVGKKETHAPRFAPTPKLPTQKTAPATGNLLPPEQPKFKPVEKIPARACVSCKTVFTPEYAFSTQCPYCYTLSRFAKAKKLYDTEPAVKETTRLIPTWGSSVIGLIFRSEKSYLAKKGFTIDDLISAGLDVRQGQDKRGRFIIVQATNGHQITGYQKIYADKFTDNNGKARDKDFIFYPKKDGSTHKTGSYIVLGSLDNAGAGLFFCEGLATGLTVFMATGKTTIVCFDAGNLSPVMANFSDYTKKYIAADNDLHADNSGNTGIYSALKAAKRHKARVFVATDTDSAGNLIKCDFNDLMQSKGIEAVKYQLRTRLNDNEVKPSNETIFKYCPEPQLKKLALDYCYQAAGRTGIKSELKSESNALQAMFDNRGFTEFKARKVIFSALRGAIITMQNDNCFSGHELVTRIDVKGLSNEAIAAKVANLKGLVIDNRGMAAGKTELMRLITEQLKTAPKPLPHGKKHALTENDLKAYFLSDSVLNAHDWQRLKKDNVGFSEWQRLNHDKALEWLKFTPTAELVKPHSIVAIAHRTSLIDSLSNRLNLPHYDRVKTFNPDHVAVCLPSICKFESMKATVLFMDEFRQDLEFLHNSGGCIDNPLAVEKQLIELINGAGLVIAADADFNQASLEWVLTNCPTMPIYWLDNGKQQRNGKTIQLLEGKDSIDKLIERAGETITAGGRVWLAFDSETAARKAYANLKLKTDSILLVTGENKAGENGSIEQALFLDNPNEISENYQVIIHSPVISSGVSITKEFDFVGAGFYGVIPPNEQLQTVARVRTAKNIYVALMSEIEDDRATNEQDLIDSESIKRGRYCESAGSLTLTSFDKFRNKQIATTNNALNNSRQYFKILAQLKGYSVKEAELTDAEYLAACANETVKTKISTKDVKEFKVAEILASESLSESEFLELDKKTATTQEQTNAITKYHAKGMTGKSYQHLISEDVYFFEYQDGLSKVKNAELINADIEQPKHHDRLNHETRQKLASDTSKAFLFSYVFNALNGQPVKRALIQQCLDFLHLNHKEVAGNGLGAFGYKTQSIKKLNAFLGLAGYELVETGREATGGRERIYTLQLNPLVAEYLQNRARLKSEAKEQTESELIAEMDYF